MLETLAVRYAAAYSAAIRYAAEREMSQLDALVKSAKDGEQRGDALPRKVLADYLEENPQHLHDDETLTHLRSEPGEHEHGVEITHTDGKVYAEPAEDPTTVTVSLKHRAGSGYSWVTPHFEPDYSHFADPDDDYGASYDDGAVWDHTGEIAGVAVHHDHYDPSVAGEGDAIRVPLAALRWINNEGGIADLGPVTKRQRVI